MELPDIGLHCSDSECKTLDFLPFKCDFCKNIFCKEHFSVIAHDCPKTTEISTSPCHTRQEPRNFSCSHSNCSQVSVVQTLCVKCKLHFCLTHRFHNCFNYSEEEMAAARLKIMEPRDNFNAALKKVTEKVENKIEISKNAVSEKDASKRALALKIELMRLKSKAKGEVSVPTTERVYFSVFLPRGMKDKNVPVYVSKFWSVGRIIDFIASSAAVPNNNNVSNADKLRLFSKTTGRTIADDLGSKLSDLIDEKYAIINNGDSLILEYVPASNLNQNYVIDNPSAYN